MIIESQTAANGARVSLRCQALADELFGAVKGELRSNGKAVFPDNAALASGLNYAFRKGLIDGAQEKPNAPIWLERESALNYIATYVEAAQASESGKVVMAGTRPAKPARDARRKRQRLIATKKSVDATFGESYLLRVGEQLFNLGRQPSVESARLAAFQKIGGQLYRSDGSDELVKVEA